MLLTVLNTNRLSIAVIDTYESLIWTDRYSKCGDFELRMPLTGSIPWYLRQENILINNESEHAMIIETIEIESDAEEGNHLTITGRSLESILDRRIVWGQKSFNGNLQDGIETLLNECFINPEDSKRKVENFVFKRSVDPAITDLVFEDQYLGNSLLEVIEKLCGDYSIGYKITFDKEKRYVFELYAGVDRSYGQLDNPFVVFSPEFENIINSRYLVSTENYKNVALVAGEGDGADRTTVVVGSDEVTGLDRREIFTDAGSVTQGNDVTYEAAEPEEPKRGTGFLQMVCVGTVPEDEWVEEPKPGITLITPESYYGTGASKMMMRSSGVATVAESDGPLSDEEYRTLLIEKGAEQLVEHAYTEAFEGQIDTNKMFKYKEDFFNGDIVQFANEYGSEVKVRILEIVMSIDKEGFLIYPTFSVINEEGDVSE